MYILRQEAQTGQINEWMNKGIDEWIVRTPLQVYLLRQEVQTCQMNEWKNEWMNEWMNELMNE